MSYLILGRIKCVRVTLKLIYRTFRKQCWSLLCIFSFWFSPKSGPKIFNSAEKICIISYFTRHHPDWIHNFVLMLLYLGNANTKSVADIMVNIIWVTQFYSKKTVTKWRENTDLVFKIHNAHADPFETPKKRHFS